MNLSTQPVRAVPKPNHGRKTAKRANRGRFSPRTIRSIGERDGWLCVRCRSPYIESVPHHIVYKSQLGKGTVDNGVTICRPCHDLAHSKREVREWFERYREKKLEEAKHG